MGYAKISNLYKDQRILMFSECFALEKIHGTSAHIRWKNERVELFAGGAKHETFAALFDRDLLEERFRELGHDNVTIYGEAYGGKMQGMSDTYGPELKFVAFEVKVGSSWLNVPDAEDVTMKMGLNFVHYERIKAALGEIDAQRDADSFQAYRNGMGWGKKREGIVLRPIEEMTDKRGERVLAKHKRDDFRETKTPRQIVDPSKLEMLRDAEKVADEWVTDMRLRHVLDQVEDPGMEKMGEIIGRMVQDVKIEGEGEIEWSKPVQTAIGRKTAKLTKIHFNNRLHME